MKLSKVSIMLVGAAFVFSSGALAGESHKGKLQLAEKIEVAGKAINPGEYKVEWTGSGMAVQVSLVQGKQTIATFPAHVTEEATPNKATAYLSSAEMEGSRSLKAIYIGGKRTTLELEQKEASQQMMGSSESK
jgi:hypothetical protein